MSVRKKIAIKSILSLERNRGTGLMKVRR